MDQQFFAETPKRMIDRLINNGRSRKAELDLDLIYDGPRLGALYKELGNLRGVANATGLNPERVKDVLRIHGHEINQRGGAYQTKRKKKDKPLDLSAVKAIGDGYSLKLKAELIAHSHENVRLCPPHCPNAVVCWSEETLRNRTKRATCTLRDHLIAVGILSKVLHG